MHHAPSPQSRLSRQGVRQVRNAQTKPALQSLFCAHEGCVAGSSDFLQLASVSATTIQQISLPSDMKLSIFCCCSSAPP
jgi:hypothetical protein